MATTVERDRVDDRPVPTNKYLMEQELLGLCPRGCEECDSRRETLTRAIAEWDEEEDQATAEAASDTQVDALISSEAQIAQLMAEKAATEAEVQQLREELAAKTTEGEAFLERIVERLHDEAEQRDWCSDYDRIMGEIGLPGRYHNYCVEVTATIPVTLNIRGRDGEEAKNEVTDTLVWQDIRNNFGYSQPEFDIEVAQVYEDG